MIIKYILTFFAVCANVDLICIRVIHHTPTVITLGDILKELALEFQWALFVPTLGIFIFSLVELRKQPRRIIDFANTLLSLPMVAYGFFHSHDLFKMN